MKFKSPEFFYLLAILPFIFWSILYSLKKNKKLIFKYFTKINFKKTGVRLKKSKVYFKIFLLLIVYLLIIFAMAKPQYGYKDIILEQRGENIFIALDVSLSMRAQDVPPSRIELAKRKILDFVSLLKGERVSLVCFAGVSFINIPLTTDYSIFYDYLPIIDTDLIPVQGTNFYNLIEKISEVVKRKNLTNTNILILSDGEDFSGNIKKALEMCKRLKIRIFTIGIGKDKPVPIRLKDGSLKKDKNGNIVLTSLNEEFLKKISLETGGVYIKGTFSSKDVKVMYNEISKSFKEGKFNEKKRIYINRFKWFVLPAFILLCLYFLIDERKKTTIAILLILISTNLFGANPSILNKEGVKLYKKGEFNLALKKFVEAYKIDKNNKFLYNKALSLYKLGKKSNALKIFHKLTNINNSELKEKSFYNIGVINYREKKFKEALENFKKALEINPDDMQARIDYELTLQKLKNKSKKNKQNKQNQNKQKKKNNKNKNDNKNKNNNKQNKQQNIHKQQIQQNKEKLNKKELEKLLNLYNEKREFLKEAIKKKIKVKNKSPQKDW